jgi:hypothetical protein
VTVEYSPGSPANRSQSLTKKEKLSRCVARVILFPSHSLTPPSQLATRSTFKHPSHRGPNFHLELKCGEIDQDVISIDRALRAKAIATAIAVTVQHKPPPVSHTAVVITPKVASPAPKRRRRGASPRRPEAIDIDAWTSADIVQRRKWVKQQYNRNYMARKKEQRRLAAAQEMIKEEVKEEEILEPVATSRDDDDDHDDHVMDTQDADTTYPRTDVLYDEVSDDDSTDVQETEDEEYAKVRAPIDNRFRWWY